MENDSNKCMRVSHTIINRPFNSYDISNYDELYVYGSDFPLKKDVNDFHDKKMQLKPFVAIENMYKKLEKEGIIFTEAERKSAEEAFYYINYYRLSVYRLLIEPSRYTFSRMLNLYYFDEKLRDIINSLIPTIENGIKRHFAYSMSHTYENVEKDESLTNDKYPSAICYLDKKVYKKEKTEEEILRMLSIFADILNSKKEKDSMIKHHIENYGGHIPIWVLVEFLTLGNMYFLSINVDRKYRKAWSRLLINDASDDWLPEWIKTILNLRNMCAHNARLYGSRPIYNPRILEKDVNLIEENNENVSIDKIRHTIFAGFITMKYFYLGMPSIEKMKWNNAMNNLASLINEYEADLYRIGFPKNWRIILKID